MWDQRGSWPPQTSSIKSLRARIQSIVYRQSPSKSDSTIAVRRILLSSNSSGTPLARRLARNANLHCQAGRLTSHAVPRQAESLSFQDSFNASQKYWFCHAQQFTAVAGNRAHVSIAPVSFIERDGGRAHDATPVNSGSAANYSREKLRRNPAKHMENCANGAANQQGL